MVEPETCPVCRKPLPVSAPAGLCPTCLITGLLEPDEGPATDNADLNLGSLSNPQTSEVIGDYELIEPIGRGGMGIVWRARQRSLRRMVALKMIRTGEFADLNEIRRFRNEAESAAMLNHPNIVPIYEIGEESGRHYFSMRLLEGGTLSDRMANRQILASNRDGAALLAKVARAVDFAHQRGLLHRDLKPTNILLDAAGEPFVADFGLVRRLGVESSLTVTGHALGSPAYMAPEQATSSPDAVTTSVDIYSLGAILFHWLTGRPPFQAATPLETLRQVAENEPPRPRSLNSAIAPDLETICLKCLAKDPAQRYTSARALAEDLERWQRDEPILARAAGVWERALKWTRRHPAAAAFSALALIAPIIIISVLLVMGDRVTRERDSAQRQAQITRENLYAADLALAYHAFEDHNYSVAWRSLAAHRPAAPLFPSSHTSDLRGFEWRWLWQRAQGEARATFAAHFAEVRDVAYSPDGRFVASASRDGTTKLWDAAQEKLLRTLEVPGNPKSLRTYTEDGSDLAGVFSVYSARFSADSRALLTGAHATLDLWDPRSGLHLANLSTNGYGMAVFSPVDPNLALAWPNYPRTSLGLLDISNRCVSAIFTNGRLDALCFSPDGRQFARWDREVRRIWLQELPSGKVLGYFDCAGYVLVMAFSPDGRTLAACNMEKGHIELFQVGVERPARQLLGHNGRVEALAISPDGRLLASGGFDQTIRLWSLPTEREVGQLHGHRSGIYCLAFSPDSKRLVSGGHDGTVRFWNVEPPDPVLVISNIFGAFAFSQDGRHVMTQNSNAVAALWELPARRLLRQWDTPPFQSAVFTTNGELFLASISISNDPPGVRVLPPSIGSEAVSSRHFSTPICRLSALRSSLPSPCSAIALSPNGQFTVTGHRDGTIAFWETRSGRLIHSADQELDHAFHHYTPEVTTLAFSPGGRTVAAARFEGVALQIWTLPEMRQLGSRYFGYRYELKLALSPDGQHLAVGGSVNGSSIQLWDAALMGPPAHLRGHQDFLVAAAYSPDGRTLASGGRDGLLKLWHLPTKREVGTVLRLPKETKFVQITFSADGAWLGASDTSGTLHLWHGPPLAQLDAAADAEIVNQRGP